MAALALLALSSISGSLAATVVLESYQSTQCEPVNTPGWGTKTALPAYLPGCTPHGFAACGTTQKVWLNDTDAGMGCPNKLGDEVNATAAGNCVTGAANVTYACVSVDGTQRMNIIGYAGTACNGTASPLGIMTIGVCTKVLTAFAKVWANSTGVYAGLYGSTNCATGTEVDVAAIPAASTSGCYTKPFSLFSSVGYALLENPTAAPTAKSSNGTGNTSAPSSSSTMAAASLASVVLAAATLVF